MNHKTSNKRKSPIGHSKRTTHHRRKEKATATTCLKIASELRGLSATLRCAGADARYLKSPPVLTLSSPFPILAAASPLTLSVRSSPATDGSLPSPSEMVSTLESSAESDLELAAGEAPVLKEEPRTAETAVAGGDPRRRSEAGAPSCVRVRVSSGKFEIAI